MSPDDPRHGTEAGCEQHYRDNEPPCAGCYDAKLRASRRRTKRKTMGYKYRVPVGQPLHDRLLRLQARGASHQTIAAWADLSQPLISRIFREGPEAVISTRTVLALRDMRVELPVTPIGATRRIQALAYLGYSADRVSREAGLHEETVKEMRNRPGAQIMSATAEKIAATYDRLSMTLPEGGSKQVRAGISRSRNIARRNGWLPPLAWDDIDDPNEHPGIAADMWDESSVDHAVVLRVLRGERKPRKLTNAEAAEVVRRAVASGMSTTRIEDDLGLKPERYLRIGGAA